MDLAGVEGGVVAVGVWGGSGGVAAAEEVWKLLVGVEGCSWLEEQLSGCVNGVGVECDVDGVFGVDT